MEMNDDSILESKALKKLRKQEKKLKRKQLEEENVTVESKKSKNDNDNKIIESSSFEEINKNIVEEITVHKKKSKKVKRDDSIEQSIDEVDIPGDIEKSIKLSKKKEKKNKSKDDTIAISSTMSDAEVVAYRTEMGIDVTSEGDASYCPVLQFSSMYPMLGSWCPQVEEYIVNSKFKVPTPIQAQCWPPLLAGRDVVGIAQTGSGKTLAFAVPAMLRIAQHRASVGAKAAAHRPTRTAHPLALVVAPTRELAMQSADVVRAVGGVAAVTIYGGVPKQAQLAELRSNIAGSLNGVELIVATPGRLIDFMDEGLIDLGGVTYLVLDEADRMLDEGFEQAMRKIIASCASVRQTVLFSATWPEEVRTLAASFLRGGENVVRVTVGSAELSANHRVTQRVECIDANARNKRLLVLLADYHKSRTNRCLLFVLYKREAVTLLTFLEGRGFTVGAIHGDRSQADRSAALAAFKDGSVPLLIATDVAARGLDIPQVEYVINYSFPLTVEDYVHRIGRTGRGGASGVSHTFFCESDKTLAGALVAVLEEAGQSVPQEIYQYPMVTKRSKSKLYGDFGPKADLMGKKATKIVFD